MRGVYLFFTEENESFELPSFLTSEFETEDEKENKGLKKDVKWYKEKALAKTKFGNQNIKKVLKETGESMSMIEVEMPNVDNGELQQLLNEHKKGKLKLCLGVKEITQLFDNNTSNTVDIVDDSDVNVDVNVKK